MSILELTMLIVLLLLGVSSIIANNAKMTIIRISAFGYWMAFIYLYYHAPDVALAEAVISTSLASILFIFSIKNYKDVMEHPTRKDLSRVYLWSLVLVAGGIVMVFLTNQVVYIDQKDIIVRIIEDVETFGNRVYPVAAILLDYRVFDTVFEALILLIAGMDVAHMIKFSRLKQDLY